MKKTLHKNESRGFADHGWLTSRHTFSFASYQNPERMNFGVLRVINDDWIEPSRGFDTHGHENMEIVSVPLEGGLAHKDSMGNESIISKGEVQRMSAGTGVTHSEYNPSETEKGNFLQIWILPKEKGIEPGYGQKKFSESDRQNKFQTVVSPDEREGSIWINQDAFFSLANLSSGTELNYEVKLPTNGAYLFVINGKLEVAGETLETRDALGLEDISSIPIKATTDTELLVIDVPMS